MTPTLAELRESFPELDEGRCESLLRIIERAVAEGPPAFGQGYVDETDIHHVQNVYGTRRRVLILPEGK